MSAAPRTGRFVVQAHDVPPVHYDLMLEGVGALETSGLAAPPEPPGARQTAARQQGPRLRHPHR